ncbi:metacaspase 2f, metacaspase 9 [Hibiscus trionum]|uniref:Metacaspase 2f, metacaspase 9 n=1 Tax=Hibiscus trionum TaxID=183268 RepID=A0A9W7I202_HIBTR|nr:metacaspase 2f, metacaspase 9 [Hibiscus trionum]
MSRATKRAVLVGCNYPSTQLRLQGCINDVLIMDDLIVKEFGFDQHNVKYFTDELGTPPEGLPTRVNIMAALEEMVEDAVAGDVLFFHFSGHGTTLSSLKPGESYKEEEAIVPCDLNLITDMDLRLLIQKLKPGTSFTILSDSCHSGGLIDKDKEQIGPTRMKGLPFPVYYKSRGISIGTIMNCLHSVTGAISTGVNILNGVATVVNTGSTIAEGISSALTGIFKKDVSADFLQHPNEKTKRKSLTEDEGLLLSGCQANETSADLAGSALTEGRAHGAFTYAVVNVLNQSKGLSNKELVKEVRKFLQDQGIEQHPCLYSSDGNADAPFLGTQNTRDRKKLATTDKFKAGEIRSRIDADETPDAYHENGSRKRLGGETSAVYRN